jgi:prevent-host-death family protein
MKIASIAEVKSKFSEYIKECKNGAVIVTKNGKPAAVLLSVTSDDELEKIILSQSKIFQNIISKADKRLQSGKGLKHKLFWDKAAKSNKH